MTLRVDVISGATECREEDLFLPGHIPLRVARSYRSDRQGGRWLGAGWALSLDIELDVGGDHIRYREGGGREILFGAVESGVRAVQEGTGYVLEHHPEAYIVLLSADLRLVFPKQLGARGVAPIGRIEDPSGNHLQFGYRGRQLAQVADTLGRLVSFRYQGDMLAAIEVARPGGGSSRRVRTYQHDHRGDLVAVSDAAGMTTRYAYQHHFMVSRTNRIGGEQYAQYDEDGRCLACWSSDESMVRRFDYDAVRQLTSVVDSGGLKDVYQHVNKTFVLKRTVPSGNEEGFYYDEQEHLIGFSDEEGILVTFQREDMEERTFVQLDGESRSCYVQRDDKGRAASVADAMDRMHEIHYDERGRTSGITMPSGARWDWQRDDRGRITDVSSPEERRLRLRWQGTEGCVLEDDEGILRTLSFDEAGRVRRKKEASGAEHAFSYDPEGRLTEVGTSGGYVLRFAHDGEGNLTGVSDTLQRRDTLRYDPFGRLVSYAHEQARWQFGYDREGRLQQVTDRQGQTTQLIYGNDRRVQRVVSPDERTTLFSYQDDGAVILRSEQGEGQCLFNALGQLVEESFPQRPEREFSYGPSGELQLARVGDREHSLAYSEDGHLQRLAVAENSLHFTYDLDGVLQAVARDGASPLYLRHDGRAQLASLQFDGHEALSCTVDRDGRLAAMPVPDGEPLAIEYDSRGLVAPRKPDGTLLWETPAGLESEVFQMALDTLPDGLALSVRHGVLRVPVWRQARPPEVFESFSQAIVRMCLDGAATTNGRRRQAGVRPLETWSRWKRAIEHRCFLTGLPLNSLPKWLQPLASAQALRPDMLDAGILRHAPCAMPPSEAGAWRGGDPVVTGPQRRGPLRPACWPERAIYPEARLPYGMTRRGGPSPEELLQWIAMRPA